MQVQWGLDVRTRVSIVCISTYVWLLGNRVHNFNVFFKPSYLLLSLSFSFSCSHSSFSLSIPLSSENGMKAPTAWKRTFLPREIKITMSDINRSVSRFFPTTPCGLSSTFTNPRHLITLHPFAPLRERTKPGCIELIHFISALDLYSQTKR